MKAVGSAGQTAGDETAKCLMVDEMMARFYW